MYTKFLAIYASAFINFNFALDFSMFTKNSALSTNYINIIFSLNDAVVLFILITYQRGKL